MAMSFPFLWINHGTPDLESVDKCTEVFLWFARPVAEREREEIMRGCPEPVAYVWGWGDSFCYFGSRGDSYDSTVLWKYAPRELVEAQEKAIAARDSAKMRSTGVALFNAMSEAIDGFVLDLERWITHVHNTVPIALFWGVSGTPDDDPWHTDSVARIDAVMSEKLRAFSSKNKGERQLFAWIQSRCAPLLVTAKKRKKASAASAPSDSALIETLDAMAARALPRKYVSRLSYEESALLELGACVDDFVHDGRDFERRLRSLAPSTQLAYLASYAAERRRSLDRIEDPINFVSALCKSVAEKQQRAVVPLVVMMASAELHDTPAFDRARRARAPRAAKLLSIALSHPRCRAGTFARASRYLRWAGEREEALRVARDGLARFGERPVLLRALARAERALARVTRSRSPRARAR